MCKRSILNLIVRIKNCSYLTLEHAMEMRSRRCTFINVIAESSGGGAIPLFPAQRCNLNVVNTYY